MGESEITFGDKLFLYGQYLQFIEEFDQSDYNSVLGYNSFNGYTVSPISTMDSSASIHGFVVDNLGQSDSLELKNGVFTVEWIDVTGKLARRLPILAGTKIWMPTTERAEVYFPRTEN